MQARCLIPAAARGAALKIDAAIDQNCLDHVPAIIRVVNGWWDLVEVEVVAEAAPAIAAARSVGTGQRFTGGVDSYYALVTADPLPDVLVFGHGFDIELRDRRRLEAFVPSLKETASAYGSRPVVTTRIYGDILCCAGSAGRRRMEGRSLHWVTC